MTQRAIFVFLPVMFFLSLGTPASAQHVFRTPTPTPTPKASPSPTPTPPVRCPSVNVQAAPGGPVRDGQPVTFTANITGGDQRAMPTILWSISAGFITRGQNERRIEVDTTGAGSLPEREIKADVWIGGYAPECLVQGSGVVKLIPSAERFGEFGVVDDQRLKINLDALAQFMAQTQDSVYVIAYAGRNSERNFTFNWLKRIKEGLLAAGVDARRVSAMDGGFREDPVFDFWIVPRGAIPPRPEPTVKRSEIVYPKTAPEKKP